MSLIFDEATHTYLLGDAALPSVTGIIKDMGLVHSDYFTEYSRDRGTKVHQAIQLHNDGELDEDTLDPVLRPYLTAWQRFKDEAHVTIEASEVRLASEVYRFAGTIDAVGTIGGTPAILDIKSGQVQPWTAIQLAGYHILLDQPARKRYAVQLKEDGSYRLHEFKDRQDRGVFLAALTIHQWKGREGNGN